MGMLLNVLIVMLLIGGLLSFIILLMTMTLQGE